MSSLKGEHKQKTRDQFGYQYILGFKNKNGQWVFPRHRFQIADPKICFGQFLTDIWFQDTYYFNNNEINNLEFLILGIKNNIDYIRITSLVNEVIKNQINNKLSETEKSVGIIFKDYFTYNKKKLIGDYNNSNKDIQEEYELVFTGKLKESTLIFKMRYIENGIYLTLPSFSKIENIEYMFGEWEENDKNINKKSLFKKV